VGRDNWVRVRINVRVRVRVWMGFRFILIMPYRETLESFLFTENSEKSPLFAVNIHGK